MWISLMIQSTPVPVMTLNCDHAICLMSLFLVTVAFMVLKLLLFLEVPLMDQKFYVLRAKRSSDNRLVQHLSITAFGCLVTTTGDWLRAMLFSYDKAVAFCDYLNGSDHDGHCYEIVLLDDL